MSTAIVVTSGAMGQATSAKGKVDSILNVKDAVAK